MCIDYDKQNIMIKSNKFINKLTENKFLVSLLVFLISFNTIIAQGLVVNGVVSSSEDNSPIPGVSVVVKGTTNGTTTDFDGKYSLRVNTNDELIFSYLGYENITILVDKSKIDVQLSVSVDNLEEVVIIGYGAVKKKEVTGAVAQLSADNIESISTTDLGTALQGQVAGVNIISSDQPGGDSEILIRGITSLNDNSPLYVVDGIVQNGNPRIPPYDIESLVILKDAASTAIYGVRGATGVILITTKQGRPGTLQVRGNFTMGVQERRSAVPLMNSIEQSYFDVIQSINVNNILPEDVNLQLLQQPFNFLNETDLNDLVFKDEAPVKNLNFTISGGKEDINYNVNLGYFNQEGLQINSGFERANVRANTVYEKDKLRIQSSVAVIREERDIAQGNLLSQSIVYRPTQNGINLTVSEDLEQGGNDVTRLTWVLESLKTTNVQKTTRTNVSSNIAYQLTDDLKLSANLGYSSINLLGKIIRPYTPVYNTQGNLQTQPENSFVDNRTRFTSNMTGEIGTTFNKTFKDDHQLTLTAFLTSEKNTSEAFSARRRSLTIPGSTVLDLATGTQSVTSGFDYTDTRIGLLGRLQYDYKGKYILSSSVRRDGSSKFSYKQWGTFPSLSFAWNISEEPFWATMKGRVNNFRIRASQGTVGVDRTPSYSFDPTLVSDINYFGYNPDTDTETINLGVTQTDFNNALLQWESTTQTNVGVDLALLNNKLTLAADYYYADKENMLFPIFLPPSSGGGENARVVLNVGNMINRGVEFSLGYKGRIGKININMNGTFSTNQNEITKINGQNDFLLTNDFGLVGRAPQQSRITALAVGREVAAFYIWRTNGIIDTEEKLTDYQNLVGNAKMGDTVFIDQNNDGVLDDNDRVYSGSGLPDYEIGYTLNARYKRFDFSMNWYAAIGQEIMNGFDAWAYGFGRHKDLVYQWSPVNQDSPIPAYRDDMRRHPNYLGYSDFWLEDGSYIRLKQASLGYSVPMNKLEKWGLDFLRFYIRGQNLLTFTKYSGYNPEVGGGISGKGLDKNTGPIAIQFFGGIQFNF